MLSSGGLDRLKSAVHGGWLQLKIDLSGNPEKAFVVWSVVLQSKSNLCWVTIDGRLVFFGVGFSKLDVRASTPIANNVMVVGDLMLLNPCTLAGGD